MTDFNWLTPRDKAAYEFLSSNALYATTTQLSELFYSHNDRGIICNSRAICRRRMARLQQYFPNIQSFLWLNNTDKVYTSLSPKLNAIAIDSIAHSLKLVDLYINIHNHATAHGHKIHNILFETKLANGIVPDIILIYVINNKARIFFIEYDTGSEALPRIKQKLIAYRTYFDKQLYLHEPWQPSIIKPELIFITNTQNRADKISNLGGVAYVAITDALKY